MSGKLKAILVIVALIVFYVVGGSAGDGEMAQLVFYAALGIWAFVALGSISAKKKDAETKEEAKALLQWRSHYLLIPALLLGTLLFTFGSRSHEAQQAAALLEAADTTEAWLAERVPMAHLEDSMSYVSNPDGVVSDATVERMNKTLRQMDTLLNVETAVIIVNHVHNADIENFAQTIGDKYGVGRSDRGLIMVMAYRDKLFRMHTGRELEVDLTDAECSRLEQDYFVPAMKADKPDTAMVYLTEAVSQFIQKKQLPVLQPSSLLAEGPHGLNLVWVFVAFLVWVFSYFFMSRKAGWSQASSLLNPPKQPAEAPVTPIPAPVHDDKEDEDDEEDKPKKPQDKGPGGKYGGGKFGGGGATTSW